ncbi:MAG: outer membrane beta-barrel protein [Pseudomonadota bacterium]
MQTLKLWAGAALIVAVAITPSALFAADAIETVEPAPAPPEYQIKAIEQSYYAAARIGAAFDAESRFGVLGTTVGNAYDTGYNFSVALGYGFNPAGLVNFRAEAELGYTQLDIDSHTVAGLGKFSGGDATGDASAVYGLANGYVDYSLGAITPFVSAGVGYGQLDLSQQGVTPTGVVMNDSAGGLAWQVGAGAAFAVTDSVTVDLGYRFFKVQDVGLSAVDGTQSDVDLESHQINLGIRKAF